MRFLVTTVLLLVCTLAAIADEETLAAFSKPIKASLVFRDDSDVVLKSYPHVLKVFLRLDNVSASDVTWVADSTAGVQAELLDERGKPVQMPPFASSFPSISHYYQLPVGSRLDWLISQGGISMSGDAQDKYALMIGGKGWLVPIKTASSYTLRIRLRGFPWVSLQEAATYYVFKIDAGELLLDLPPTKLNVTK